MVISLQISQMGTTAASFSPLTYLWASLNPAIVMFTLLQPGFADEIQAMTLVPLPLWASYMIIYVLIAIASLLVAVKRLRVNMNKYK